MTRGVVFVAHNTENINYYQMAVYAAQHVHEHLNLPVTIITDINSLPATKNTIAQTILVEPNPTNHRNKNVWINKNRFRVYDLSPYDETIVLDTDYIVNSKNLLRLFDYSGDFKIHNNVRWLMIRSHNEYLGSSNIPICWATVMFFRKTDRTQQIFDMMEMIQDNYEHYSQIYGFLPYTFRNDYAITIALKTVNGHLEQSEDYIPWNLIHVDRNIKVTKNLNHYILTQNEGGINWYLKIKDMDFHMIGKGNYMDLHK